ncbi:MAG: HIRAN domain-containing protein [Clostridiaceae bacterium]|nr:HIRAN domain-containing protein [Clostridiaceae bacterium]
MGEVYKKIKGLQDYDTNSGKFELNYLYLYDNISIYEEVRLVEDFTEKLIELYKSDSFEFDFLLKEIPLIYYYNSIINRVNLLVKEEVLDGEWLSKLTHYLIYDGKDSWEVKLGLILSCDYLDNDELKDIVDAFSKSGEFIFYLTNTIKKLKHYNTFIFELAKKTTGTIKVFAITNLEMINKEIVSYLIEEGYKDNQYERLLKNYILSVVKISEYLKDGSKEELNKLSFLLCDYLREQDLSKMNIRDDLLDFYVQKIFEVGEDFYSLCNLIQIKDDILDEADKDESLGHLEEEIDVFLCDTRWENLFLQTVRSGRNEVNNVMLAAEYFGYYLTFEDLKPYLKKDWQNYYIYIYVIKNRNREDASDLIDYFNSKVDIGELCLGAKDLPREELDSKHINYILFSMIIKLSRIFYPRGKDIALMGIKAESNDCRLESIKNLTRYRDKITTSEWDEITKAYEIEPNEIVKEKFATLIYYSEAEKKEFIDIKDFKIAEHVNDTYLITTQVAGVKYRNRRYLEETIEKSRIFYLINDDKNDYDKNAIKIVGDNGYVIGFVPSKDNVILHSLLMAGKYLYCRINDCKLEDNLIEIKVYLSYRYVIEAINDTNYMLNCQTASKLIN